MNLKPWQMKKLVSEKIDLVEALYKVNPEGFYEVGQQCYCPFHDNENTPAASIYEDEKRKTLYCFSERKLYDSSDVLEILLKRDVFSVAERIWSTMTEADKSVWLSENSADSYEDAFSIEEDTKENNTKLDIAKERFKSGKIKVKELLQAFIENA